MTKTILLTILGILLLWAITAEWFVGPAKSAEPLIIYTLFIVLSLIPSAVFAILHLGILKRLKILQPFWRALGIGFAISIIILAAVQLLH